MRRTGKTRLARCSLLICWLISVPATPAGVQSSPGSWKERLAEELRIRVEKIVPKKLKTRGKPAVAKWEDVDKVLAEVGATLNLRVLLEEIQAGLPPGQDTLLSTFREEVDEVLARQPILYRQLYYLEKPGVYFPLTNNVLRLGSDEALVDLPVFDNTGYLLGTYAGKYVYEKTGGVSSGSGGYRLTYFQFRDREGNIRPSGTINLLDTYTVSWDQIKEKPGFVLTAAMFLD